MTHKKVKNLSLLIVVLTLVGVIASTPSLIQAATGIWSNTGSLNLARRSHTMTLLPDGKVLAVGGCNDTYCSGKMPDYEIYNPTLGTWSLGEIFADGQYIGFAEHTATLLLNGKVLIVGEDTALYDPPTNQWHTTGDPVFPRWCGGGRISCHTATLLPDGKMLVTGGYTSSVTSAHNNAEIYNPTTETWSSAGNMHYARASHAATLLPSGKVLIVGGGGYLADYLASAELYDPTTNTWADTGSMHYRRYGHTATLLQNGKVLVLNGGDEGAGKAELYDPSSGVWSDTGSMNDLRSYQHTATLLPNGKVLVAGGLAPNGAAFNNSALYDPISWTWSNTVSMGEWRANHAAILLQDNKVLVSGGVAAGSGSSATAKLYDTGIPVSQIYLPLIVR